MWVEPTSGSAGGAQPALLDGDPQQAGSDDRSNDDADDRVVGEALKDDANDEVRDDAKADGLGEADVLATGQNGAGAKTNDRANDDRSNDCSNHGYFQLSYSRPRTGARDVVIC